MTGPFVVHRDAAALVAAHLRSVLPGYGVTGPVVTRVPNPRPARWTLCRRIGGVARNVVVDGPMLDVQRWIDDDEHQAMDDLQVIRAVIRSLPGQVVDGTQVYRVIEIQGPAMQDDTASQTRRATYVAEVLIRGTT